MLKNVKNVVRSAIYECLSASLSSSMAASQRQDVKEKLRMISLSARHPVDGISAQESFFYCWNFSR
jgi:hypothetical protein